LQGGDHSKEKMKTKPTHQKKKASSSGAIMCFIASVWRTFAAIKIEKGFGNLN